MFGLFSKKIIVLIVIFLLMITGVIIYESNQKPIDFTTQVKPIINKNCITCHGGVKQKGGFSLLFREEALAKTSSGKIGIIPGDADNSEMIRRLSLKDPEERMPYKHDALSKLEIDILTQWVDEGAHWGEHWAYTPVESPHIPQQSKFFGLIKSESKWSTNPIDNFIEDKWQEVELVPSPKADKPTLLKRVSLDIIGMPAPPNLAKQYLNDNSEDAYIKLVDALLALPSYGEKWTSVWLDLARYADSKGYEKDSHRNIWEYRDWLIKAFNQDMPYNSFLIKQFAGDLLPNPTDDDYVATAFQRNTMTNDEGGTDNEEFRTAAVMDRVNTTWQATMGTTFACVQCHSHPYDPFKHEDYYKFLAYFNETRDEDIDADYPLLRKYTKKDQLEINRVENWLLKNTSKKQADEAKLFLKTWQPSYKALPLENYTKSEKEDLNSLYLSQLKVYRFLNVDLTDKSLVVYRYYSDKKGGIWNIHLDKPNGQIIGTIPTTICKKGSEIRTCNLSPVKGKHNVYIVYTSKNKNEPKINDGSFDWFSFTNELGGGNKTDYASIKKSYYDLLATEDVKTIPIMLDNREDMRRTTHIFERGNWLVKGNLVKPGIPASLYTPSKNELQNRLGMAQWIASTRNPLTARTMVNRIWEQIFGIGIVETLEDMGSQGTSPTHPELLNWLSFQFMHQNNWSLKKTIKTIVTSATYQQSSKITEDLNSKDSNNKYYARFPRVRLSAEQIRDQALSLSGVLSNKMYGPSVFPYQPGGVWQIPYNDYKWVQSKGEDQYRRAVYTYWKRSSAYPSMLTFDGVSRVQCSSRRIRTNTPLQALTMLNDSAYLDIAYKFAIRMNNQGGNSPINQIKKGYFLATYKNLKPNSVKAYLDLYQAAYTKFSNDPKKIEGIVFGNTHNKSPHIAALTVVANAMLNTDEILTKN